MGTLRTTQFLDGRNITIRCALASANPPTTPVTLEADTTVAGGIAKGATSIPLATSIGAPIAAKNWLLFIDSVTGAEALVRVTADAAASATALAVAATPAVIPDGARAVYPPEIYDRTNVDLERSPETEDTVTLNTGGKASQVTGRTNTISCGGYESEINPGLRNFREAIVDTTLKLYASIEYPVPSNAYTRGRVVYGQVTPTGDSSSGPADGKITCDLSMQFVGDPLEVPPVVAP